MGNNCAKKNTPILSQSNNEVRPEPIAMQKQIEKRKKNVLDRKEEEDTLVPALCVDDTSNKQPDVSQQKQTPSRKEPPEKMTDDNIEGRSGEPVARDDQGSFSIGNNHLNREVSEANESSSSSPLPRIENERRKVELIPPKIDHLQKTGADVLLSSSPSGATRASTEPISLAKPSDLFGSFLPHDTDDSNSLVHYIVDQKQESNEDIKNLDENNDTNYKREFKDSNDTKKLDEKSEDKKIAARGAFFGVTSRQKELGAKSNIKLQNFLSCLDCGDTKPGTPLPMQPFSDDVEGPFSGGGGTNEFQINIEEVVQSDEVEALGFDPGILDISLDLSGGFESESEADITDWAQIPHLQGLLSDTPASTPGCKSIKRENSAVATINYKTIGPPEDLPKMNSHKWLHNSQLRTEPKYQRLLHVPTTDDRKQAHFDMDSSDSETDSDKFIEIDENNFRPLVSSLRSVQKPAEIRRVGLHAPFFQDKHYREPLTQLGTHEGVNLLPTMIINQIVEHVMVPQEEWESLFGVYSATIGMHRDWISSIDDDPANGNLVSGGRDNLVHIWDTVAAPMGHSSIPISSLQTTDDVNCVMFLDPEHVIIGTQSEMKIWNWEKGEAADSCQNYFDRSAVLCVAKMPNEPNMFVTGQEDGKLSIWDVERDQAVATREDHIKEIRAVTTVSNGRVIISGSKDCTIRIWDKRLGKKRNQNQIDAPSNNYHPAMVNGICSLSESIIATAHSDNTIKIWDYRKHSLKACLATLKGHRDYVWDVTRVADSGLLSASADACLKMWDWKRATFMQNLEGSGSGVLTLATDSNGKLFSAGNDAHVRSWNLFI